MEKDEKLLLSSTKENPKKEQIKIEKLSEDKKEYDNSIKVIFLGDTNVGKTSIIKRLKNNSFNYNEKSTLSIQYYNLIIKIKDFILKIKIWDTAGLEKYNSILSNYCKFTDVVIFVYSIDNQESFNHIPDWIKEFEDKNTIDKSNQIKILIGNKKDLEDERKITYEEGIDFYKNNGFIYFTEISCKEEENNEKFDKIIEIIGKVFYKNFQTLEILNNAFIEYKPKETKSCNC